MKSDFLIALTQLVAERHLPKEQVLEAIEAALVSAFKRDSIAVGQNISVILNPNTGEMNVFALKTVVEEVEDRQREISLQDALLQKKGVVLGDEISTSEELPHQASRIAAQTAKQVVLQRLRDAEREKTFQEFLDRTDEVVSGVVDTIEPGRVVMLELGRVEAVLPPEEQVPTERYRKGQRLKVYILDVRRTPRGPEIVVSRTHKELLKRLFEVEVPEVYNGVVEIKAISREAGFRSKVAVSSRQDGVDPVGSCIGMRGNRIQSIVNELQGEKIDIVRWDKDMKTFISNALSPSEVVHVEFDEAEQAASVVVPERQLSLAIGKEGQNARLAAKLTGWRLDIKSVVEWEEIKTQRKAGVDATRQAAKEALLNGAEVGKVSESEIEATEEAPVAVADGVGVTSEVAVASTIEEQLEELLAEEAVGGDASGVETTETPVSIPEEVAAQAFDEEELLRQMMGEEEEEGVEEEEDGDTGLALDDSVWQSPVVVSDAGKIRFAEDIVEEFRGGRRKGGGKRARRGGSQGSRAGAARTPAPGAARTPASGAR